LNFFVEKSSSGSRYTRGLRIALAVFKDQLKKETLALRGDFSYIDLRPGRMYTVSFYRNVREIVKIEEFKRKR